MTNLLSQGVTMLDRVRKARMSEDVAYTRGGDSATIAATLGESQFDVEIDGTAAVLGRSIDFVFSASDLVLGSVLTLPARGDLIDHGGRRFQVGSPSGDGPYRFEDPFRKMLRVHTREIGATP